MQIQVLGLEVDGWAALNLAIQFVLPLLVGLVTTKVTGRGVQFLLLSLLTLVSTVAIQVLQAHTAGLQVALVQIVVQAVVNFGVSLLAHYNVWKPTNLSDLVLSVFVKAPVVAPAPAPLDPTPSAAAQTPPDASLGARHLAVAPSAPDTVSAASPAPLPVLATNSVEADPNVVVTNGLNRMAG